MFESTQTRQQRSESPTVTPTWHACNLVEFMYLVFTCVPVELPPATRVFVVGFV